MKPIKFTIFILVLQLLCFSCKKEISNVKPEPVSAITVVNAVIGSNPIITDFSGVKPVSTYYATTPQINYGAFQEFGEVSGNLPLTVYQITDTIQPMYKANLNVAGGGIYSLFLTGTDPTHPDVVFNQDHPPYHAAADSVIGVRFINLSPGSNPISVNLQGAANGSLASSLSYKSITNFSDIPFTTSITQYIFEIRDASSGTLLTTYSYTTAPYQNITIAVIGEEGASAAVPISAMQENNF